MRAPCLLAAASLVVLLAACPGDDEGDDDTPADAPVDAPNDAPVEAPDALPPDANLSTGAYHHYVTSRLVVPRTSAEAQSLAFNLDLDPQNRPDNALGGVYALLASQDLDLQAPIDADIAGGTYVLLHSVFADDLLLDPAVRWLLYQGAPEPAPVFDGTGTFHVAPESPVDAQLLGAIEAGLYSGGPSTPLAVFLPVYPGAPPVLVHLIGARLEATVSELACTGKLGGGVSPEEVETLFVPAMADGLNAQIAADCVGTTCTPGSQGEKMLQLFDANDDGVITTGELLDDPLVGAILSPDIDLLDGTGAFNPRVDGVKDHVSLGLGFECVGAEFVAPGEGSGTGP